MNRAIVNPANIRDRINSLSIFDKLLLANGNATPALAPIVHKQKQSTITDVGMKKKTEEANSSRAIIPFFIATCLCSAIF
ncbi:hypothetical protein [Bacillus sp. JCM 19041]|uniref:hypothetical protein n=1 Tax=Bacillus sp. JCM 19041 TaxID=1460637 RepID=UPI0006D23E36